MELRSAAEKLDQDVFHTLPRVRSWARLVAVAALCEDVKSNELAK
jgi:hypothetical protein